MGRKPVPDEEKRVGFTFSLDPDALAMAKLIARFQDRKVSLVIDDAIRLYAKSLEGKPPTTS